MGRRKKPRPADNLMALVALMPWWAGVSLAVFFYFVHHAASVQQVVPATQHAQLTAIVTQSLWKSFANVGQFVLPIICLAGAGISAWKRRERKALVANVVSSKSADSLEGMTRWQFELFVGASSSRLRGFRDRRRWR